jgi:ADP-ribose pyrophosphatase YjhB (NUDIX family)
VAVGGIVVKRGKVLLVRRGREPNRNLWTLPGGAVRLGEGLREALVREIEEECGIEVEVGGVVEVVDQVHYDQEGRVRYHYVIIDFLVSWRAGQLSPASDILEARWVDPAAFKGLPLTEGLLPVIEKALSLRRRQRRRQRAD